MILREAHKRLITKKKKKQTARLVKFDENFSRPWIGPDNFLFVDLITPSRLHIDVLFCST